MDRETQDHSIRAKQSSLPFILDASLVAHRPARVQREVLCVAGRKIHMQWVLPVVISAAVTLLVSFGTLYFTRRHTQQDKSVEGQAAVKVAEIGANAEIQQALLERINSLEERLDLQYQRGEKRERRLSALEEEAAECKEQLALLQETQSKLISDLNGLKD